MVQANQYAWWWIAEGFASPEAKYTGICLARSKVKLAQVLDGLSKTYLLGEKYLNPQNTENGHDSGDNENYLAGFNNDSSRSTRSPPAQGKAGTLYADRFGGPHPGGVMMASVDGSVRVVGYDVDPSIHRSAGNRRDGL